MMYEVRNTCFFGGDCRVTQSCDYEDEAKAVAFAEKTSKYYADILKSEWALITGYCVQVFKTEGDSISTMFVAKGEICDGK